MDTPYSESRQLMGWVGCGCQSALWAGRNGRAGPQHREFAIRNVRDSRPQGSWRASDVAEKSCALILPAVFCTEDTRCDRLTYGPRTRASRE